MKKAQTLLLAVLLVGALLRLQDLESKAWGVDEEFQAGLTNQSLQGILKDYKEEENPPLHTLLAWVFLNGWGSYYGVQLLSVLAGVLTIAFSWLFGRLAFGERVGMLTGLLVALNPLLVFYSQHTRSYALMIMFFAAFLAALAAFLARPHRKRNWVALGATLSLLMYTHYSGILAFGVTALLLVLKGRRERLWWWNGAPPLVGAGMSFAPWLANLGGHIQTQTGTGYVHSIADLFYIFYKFGNGANMSFLFQAQPALLASSVLVNILFIAGIFLLVRGKRSSWPYLSFIPLSLLLGALVTIQISFFFLFRNFSYLIPLYLLPVAHALERAGRLKWPLLGLVIVMWAATIWLYYGVAARPDWNALIGL